MSPGAPGNKRCLGEGVGIEAGYRAPEETCTLSSRLVLVCMKSSHTGTTLRNQSSPLTLHPPRAA